MFANSNILGLPSLWRLPTFVKCVMADRSNSPWWSSTCRLMGLRSFFSYSHF